MVKEGKRTRNLESASAKVSIFAILALLASVATGFQLYKLIMDAMDLRMENFFRFLKPINLFGIQINEAQLSLALGFLMFLVPFWILISLLVKRHGLKNGEIVGTGLFWFIFLASIVALLYALGIIPKLLSGDFDKLLDFEFSLWPILGALGSLITAILSLWTIINISAADRAPAEYIDEDEYDEDIIDDDDEEYEVRKVKTSKRRRRRNETEEIIEEPIEVESISLDDDEEIDRKSPKAYGYDDEPVSTKKEEVIVKPTSTKEDFKAVSLDDEIDVIEPKNVSSLDDIEDTKVINNTDDNLKVTAPVTPLSLDDEDEDVKVKDTIVPPTTDIVEDKNDVVESKNFNDDSKNDMDLFENPTDVREEEIKITRKYIQMPGEDKVIVVTREFDSHGKLLNESTEVKNKNEIKL